MIENNDIDVVCENWEKTPGYKGCYDMDEVAECVLELDRSVGVVQRTLRAQSQNYVLAITADHETGSCCKESTGENLYSLWSHGHSSWNVPYYIEAQTCDLKEEIENTEIFTYLNGYIQKYGKD